MRRIMVIGPCGAGKSTAAREIAERLSLPLYHLDKMHWNSGWVEGSQADLLAALQPVLALNAWVIDGNYGGTMKPRLERADTIVYLDYPISLCLWRAFKRLWQYRGKTRDDMAEGCPERFNFEFFFYIARWRFDAGPRTERRLAGFNDKVLRFKQPRQTQNWLNELERTP